MSTALGATKAKVRALLAKTVAAGCTEGEALAAAAMAMRMMRDHGLTEAELDIVTANSPLGRSRRQVLDDLWPHVALVCRCKLLFVSREQYTLQFIGRDPWPEIATWLRDTLDAAHGRAMSRYRASPEYKRRRNNRTRAAARRVFTAGFVEAVSVKLHGLISDWPELRRALESLDRATAPMFAGTRTLSELGGGKGRDTERDRAAGATAGRQTPVNWGVAGSGPAGSIGSAPKLIGRGNG